MESGYKMYMKLRIRNISKDDFMKYKCVAKNSLGGSDGTITLYGIDPPGQGCIGGHYFAHGVRPSAPKTNTRYTAKVKARKTKYSLYNGHHE